MQRPDLVTKILDYMLNLYKAQYTGRIEVVQNDNTYMLLMGIPSYMVPTTNYYVCETDEEFLDYIYEELRVRNYMKIDKYQVIRTPNVREE